MSRRQAPRPRRLALESLENRLALAAFLKVPGIDGESTAPGHVNQIDVLTFHWGVQSSGGTPSVSEIVVTKVTDSSSPALFQKSLTGQVIPKIVLDYEKSTGGKQQAYYRYELENVQITSYQLGGSAEDVPLENISFVFEKIKITYKQEKADRGKPAASPRAFVVRTQDPLARGLDLNGDGTADPIFFDLAGLADLNDDGLFTLIATSGEQPVAPADLDGDGAPDDIAPKGSLSVRADLSGDGEEDGAVPVDFDGDGQSDALFLLDTNSDGIADLLAELHVPSTTPSRARR